jgi:hypothetical protein
VDIVHQLIANNEFNLLESHVFRFDFLNDEFDKLPQELQDIINDEEKRKKLIIYMNPPYAEVSSKAVKDRKAGVNLSKTHEKYSATIGTAGRELFALFLARLYAEIPGCKIATFSKLKPFSGSAFDRFRSFFVAKIKKCFIVPAYTFDNVTGKFPIGFQIWDTDIKQKFKKITADVFNANNVREPRKTIVAYDRSQLINKWISLFKTGSSGAVGFMDGINGNDFAHNDIVYITDSKEQLPNPRGIWINAENLLDISVYFAVRHCIEATWQNDRDQFLYPTGGVASKEFQNDCLIYTLFHEKNKICHKSGKNHWIPFTAREVNAKDNFKSTFMNDFLKTRKRMSKSAKAVFEAGKALWTYYHETIKTGKRVNVDASLYEIREYFKGRDEKGKMKTKATDERFNELDVALRLALKKLARKIQPKVYEYGFLKR